VRRTVIALLFVALLQVSVVSPAFAKTSKVEQARANARAVRARLAAVTAQLQTQVVRSAAAAQAAHAARAHLATARAQEASVAHRLDDVRASVKDAALRVYMLGVSNFGLSDIANLDPASAARADFLRNSALGFQSDVADQLSATRQDLEVKRKVAEGAARVAADRDRAARGAVAALKQSQTEQLKLVSAAEGRYQASLSEAALASRSRRLPGSAISLTTVHGITVATSIANNLGRMLDTADLEGFRFGGTGYRSYEGQVALRRAHCGSSSYDVYDKPARAGTRRRLHVQRQRHQQP
jgi:hypothetical protein